MDFKTFDNKQEFITASAAYIADVCRNTAGDCYIGLAGGKTPKPVYQLFGQEDIDSSRVHLFLTDERYVPHEHSDSNSHMLETSLLKQHEGQWGSVHTFDTALPIDESLEKFDLALNAVPDDTFDLLVLGVGTDGHIASLFPGTMKIDTTERVVHTTTGVHAVHDRLTITAPVIMKAKKIFGIIIRGEETYI